MELKHTMYERVLEFLSLPRQRLTDLRAWTGKSWTFQHDRGVFVVHFRIGLTCDIHYDAVLVAPRFFLGWLAAKSVTIIAKITFRMFKTFSLDDNIESTDFMIERMQSK